MRRVLPVREPPGAAVDLVSVTCDKYRRTVGVNLNLNQVHAGWAVVNPKYCADPVYYQAQEDAAAHRRGVWSVEGLQQRPRDWRRANK